MKRPDRRAIIDAQKADSPASREVHVDDVSPVGLGHVDRDDALVMPVADTTMSTPPNRRGTRREKPRARRRRVHPRRSESSSGRAP